MCGIHKKVFYFKRYYIPTIKEYIDFSITHADGQQFTHFGSSSLHEHLQWKQDQPEFFLNLQSFTDYLMKMSIEVQSLYSEQLVLTPTLNQSHPNFHLLFAKIQMCGVLYKTILAQDRPNREKQRENHIN